MEEQILQTLENIQSIEEMILTLLIFGFVWIVFKILCGWWNFIFD